MSNPLLDAARITSNGTPTAPTPGPTLSGPDLVPYSTTRVRELEAQLAAEHEENQANREMVAAAEATRMQRNVAIGAALVLAALWWWK